MRRAAPAVEVLSEDDRIAWARHFVEADGAPSGDLRLATDPEEADDMGPQKSGA